MGLSIPLEQSSYHPGEGRIRIWFDPRPHDRPAEKAR